MTEATLGAKVTADITDFTKKFDEMRSTIDRLGKGTAGGGAAVQGAAALTAKFEQLGGAISGVGLTLTKTLTPMAAPIVAIGAAATTSAIEFESAFAGVKKTVEATDAEFALMERGIRGLAKEIPVAVGELSKIAETAGALGIAKEGIVDFTRVVSQMATTTNLSSDAAANAFARIGSIMGVAAGDFQRLGSTLVDLGNKGASTESEIVGMALRLAGAAKTVGFSTAELLGFSAALANVGIRAEMGGTAMSTLLVKIAAASSEGGAKLDAIAQVAGLTGEQFQRAFKTNASDAIATFIQGLGRMQASGADLFGTLDELGLKNTRMRDTLLRLAATTDAFSGTLDTSRGAWAQNSALATEAGKRYATVQSQLDLLKNRAADVALSIGQGVLPALLKLLEASQPIVGVIGSVADAFARLDPSTQTVIMGVVALAATIGPMLMVLGTLVSSAGALVPAFSAVAAAITGLPAIFAAAGTAFTTLTTLMMAHPFVALGVAAAALATAVVLNWDKIKAVTAQLVSAVSDYLVGKLTAVFNAVKAPIEAVKGYFRGLYDAVVGHSYIPDMVDEIGQHMDRLNGPAMVRPTAAAVDNTLRHMQALDIGMSNSARNGVVQTGKILEGAAFTWQSALNQVATTVNNAWGSMAQTVGQQLALMTTSTVNWAQVGIQVGQQFLGNMIATFIQLLTQWLLTTAGITTATEAMETAKTTATATGEAARLAIVKASGLAIAASMLLTLGAIVATGTAALAVAGAVVAAITKVLTAAAIAAAVIPGGQGLAGSLIVAASVLGGVGTEAVAEGMGVIQVAAGKAIVAMGALTAAVPAFASGGAVFGPTLALVGEHASPTNPEYIGHANQLGLGGGRNVTVILEVDRRELARWVAPELVHQVRLRLGAVA